MPDDDPNPYAAPEGELSAIRPRLSIWRFTAMALCFLVGGLSFAIGMTVVGSLVFFLLTDKQFDAVDEMVPIAALYLHFGGTWLLATWCFWQRKDRWAVMSLLAGVSIPITLFSILGV